VRAHRLDLSLLQKSQQTHLKRRRDFRDFVEKHRAAVGGRKQAEPVADRARERAAPMAEQFRLQQFVRQRTAILREKQMALALPKKCTARAMSSLPVPVSPWISTGKSVAAALRARLHTSTMSSLANTSLSNS
jgi:hypothetical protein